MPEPKGQTSEKVISLAKEVPSKPQESVGSNAEQSDVTVTEQNILTLGEEYKKQGKAKELGELIKASRPFLGELSKAKAAKLVRALVDMFLDMDAGTGLEVDLCKECIEWATSEKRTFLRQFLEARLVGLYYDTGMYSQALLVGSSLLRELKKMDDKNLLVEVHLVESKTYHALSNVPKARAALTAARTTANAMYCPPKLQGALDLMSGILYAAERDFKTSYSYFYEALEGYDSISNPKALLALKYMLLCKIMLKSSEDVYAIINGKLALQYAGQEVEAMRSIAKAAGDRSLADFTKALKTFRAELEDDPVISSHLDNLYDNMLEQNLLRIIEPYSKVQVEFIAKSINLPVDQVEKKLSQMILDKNLSGILDQGAGVLVVFPETSEDNIYAAALECIQPMNKVVDTLYKKAKWLT